MKKLLIALLLAALLIPTALAETQRYDCYGITFPQPDGFTFQKTDDETLQFENATRGTAIQAFATEADGLTWSNAQTFLHDVYQFENFSCNPSGKINGVPCINCVFSDNTVPIYGRLTVFLDEAETVAWVFMFQSASPLTDADCETWTDLLCSISAPMLLPTPTPEPAPPQLDFKAVNRNPEKYKYMDFMVRGRVLQVIEGETDENGYTSGQFRLATDGEYGDEVFCYYRHGPNDDRVLEDDLIEFRGQCYGLFTYTSVRRVQVSMPLFYIFSDIHILEE